MKAEYDVSRRGFTEVFCSFSILSKFCYLWKQKCSLALYFCDAESLDVLESWVVELFGKVKGRARALPGWGMVLPIWNAGKVYHLEAVKDVHVLDLLWTLPCLRQEYLKKPEDYLAHLLGHGNLFKRHVNFFDFLIILDSFLIFILSALPSALSGLILKMIFWSFSSAFL